MCSEGHLRGCAVGWQSGWRWVSDLILEWYSSDPEFGFVGVGSEVWHGGIGSVALFLDLVELKFEL